MQIGFNYLAVGLIAFTCLLSVAGPCTCKKQNCNTLPQTLVTGFQFKLKNKITGNDIFNFPGYYNPIPDTIKLKNLGTGSFYPLNGVNDAFGNVLFTNQYNQPANINDTLIFYYGISTPDTLYVETRMIDLSQYIDCDYSEPRVTKVTVNNEVFYNIGMLGAIPVIRK